MSEPASITPTIKLASSNEEHPFFFVTASDRLYGGFHPAQSDLGRDRVLVFCHSLGVEHTVTQRMEVLAARTAAKAGFPAFCYNSRAHGDSTGDSQDLTFNDLVDDACAAADYARSLSGAARIVWVGVRFGCLIAAEAMSRRDDAAALALWEPLHQGQDYFRTAIRTTLFCQVVQGKPSGATMHDQLKKLEAEGRLSVVGTYLYQTLWRSAQQIELSRSLLNWSGNTLIAQVQRRQSLSASNQRLLSEIEHRGGTVTAALISQEPAWSMLPLVHPQWSSDPLLTAMTEWLHGME